MQERYMSRSNTDIKDAMSPSSEVEEEVTEE